MRFPFARFRVRGHSMEPALHDGDYVVVMRYLFGEPKAGDIVALQHDRMIMVKRVRKKGNGKYLVSGDNNRSNAFWAAERDIIGKMLFQITH